MKQRQGQKGASEGKEKGVNKTKIKKYSDIGQ